MATPTTPIEGLIGRLYWDGAVVGYLINVELAGVRSQTPWWPAGTYNPTQVIGGGVTYTGSAQRAFICGDWLERFREDNTEYELECFPRGINSPCVIAGTIALKHWDFIGMEAESEAAKLEGLVFDFYGIQQEEFDVVNELFIPTSDPDCNIGDYDAVRLTDGADVTVRDTFFIQDNLKEVGHVYCLVVPGATGNLRRSVETDFSDPCSEVYNIHSDNIAAGQVAVTINKVECIDVTAALTGIALNDLVGIYFTREASDALDTINADCYYLGVLLTRA